MLDTSGARTIPCQVQPVLHGLAIISSKFPLHPSHPSLHLPSGIVSGKALAAGKLNQTAHLLKRLSEFLKSAEDRQKMKHLRTIFYSWKYESPASKTTKVCKFKTGDSGWYLVSFKMSLPVVFVFPFFAYFVQALRTQIVHLANSTKHRSFFLVRLLLIGACDVV